MGGYFSPALYLVRCWRPVERAYSAIGIGLSGPLIVSGMAAVSACDWRACCGCCPGSGTYNVLQFCCQGHDLRCHRKLYRASGYGHSLFDKQLQNRNIDLSAGRVALSLSAQNLSEIMHGDFAAAAPDCSVRKALDCLQINQKSELYLIDKESLFVVKF